ncbi:MAG: OsmC family protein [Proteobacteria bacterium]|nr:OsmC family protein [Pseudomonadota bacterium]
MPQEEIKIVSIWDGGVAGRGKVSGRKFHVDIAIPQFLGGGGEGADPKELFTSATAACLISTLRSIAESKKLPLDSLTIATEAEIDEERFSIVHIVELRLSCIAAEEQVYAAEKMIQAADRICPMGKLARKAGVTIDIVRSVARAARRPC